MFQVDGNAKQKILPLWIETLRQFRAKPHHIDAAISIKVTRAYLW